MRPTSPAAFSGSKRRVPVPEPAISCCSIPSGCRAAQPARRHQERHRHPVDAPMAGRSSGSATRSTSIAFHVDVPQGVQAVDVEFQYVSATADNQGRIGDDPGDVEHPVAVAVDVSRRLLRPADPGAGVGHRPDRLEGGDRASAQRPDGRQDRLSGDQLRDPGRFAADRRGRIIARSRSARGSSSTSSAIRRRSSRPRRSRSTRTSAWSTRR